MTVAIFHETVVNPEPWIAKAICKNTPDPEIFFPASGGSAREAKMICTGCPVQAECVGYAIRTNQQHGVWGGFTEKERRDMRRAGRIPTMGPLMCGKGLHELTHETTFITPQGRRVCTACAKARWRRGGENHRLRRARADRSVVS